MKPRYLALIPIFALLLGGWLGRTQLAEVALATAMQNYGLKHVAADINHLGASHSQLARLEFSIGTEKGSFRLQADGLELQYRLEQLARRRAESLVINRLAIHHLSELNTASRSELIAEKLQPVAIIAALKRALNEYVIFNRLAVNELTLNGKSFGVLEGRPLRLQARREDAAISADLALLERLEPGPEQAMRKLTITRLSHETAQAELGFADRPGAVAARLDLIIQAARIDGDYFFNPDLLKDWLRPFVSLNAIDGTSKVSGTLAFDFAADDRVASVITARSERVRHPSYRLDDVEMRLKTGIPVGDTIQPIKLENGSHLKAGRLNHENFSLGATRVNMVGELSVPDDGWRFSGGFSVPSITALYQSHALQLAAVAARIAVSGKHLTIDGGFSPANTPGTFAFALEHSLSGQSGKLAVTPVKPIDLKANRDKLSRLWEPWPYPFDLLKGRIRLVSHASWSATTDPKLSARIQIEDGAGHIGEIVFAGLSFNHQIAIMPTLRSIQPGKVSLSQLDSGVAASNIQTTVLIDSPKTGPLPRFRVNDLYGEIFGGSFSGDDIVFDLNSDRNRFEITAKQIDLAEIVATQQLENLIVTGRVDGTIPVAINEQGLFIEHGAFINDVRAGSIRYTPAGGDAQLKQNPLTSIALDALRDFRYSHLAADVNFTPDGALVVSLQLKGTSPELDTRRPVHLNINTEQNLLSLLKSLRYAESVGASIEQRVRNKYKKSSHDEQEDR